MEATCGFRGPASFRSTLPDGYTRRLMRQLMGNLREPWWSGALNMVEAKATTWAPLLWLFNLERELDATRLTEIECGLPGKGEEDKRVKNTDRNYNFRLLTDMYR